jgi:hypothetical protein
MGQGLQLSPRPVWAAQATSVAIAVGWSFAEPFELQLALVPQVDALKAGEFDFEVRSILKVSPSGFPMFGKLIAGITQLASGPQRLALGGALGWQVHVGGVLLFAEIAMLPRAGLGRDGAGKLQWIAEGRLGGAHRF